MTQDPTYYPNPHRFRPDQWLEMDVYDFADLRKIVFRFGRWVCPSCDFADASIWLTAASIGAEERLGACWSCPSTCRRMHGPM